MSYQFSLIAWPCCTLRGWVGVIWENQGASARFLRAWSAEPSGGWKQTDASPPRIEFHEKEPGRGDKAVTELQLGGLKLKLETGQEDLYASLQNGGNIAVERTPDSLQTYGAANA